MKKLINDPANVVREALQGMEAAHSDLIKVTYDPYTIVRKDAPVQGKVALVSGGGSGHEPMHGGFVGMGMLDAACPGEVFTSPTPDQMEAATKAVDGGAGVIHIVKNYTGDVMNFEMAADLCRAEGTEVESVLVDDDVAVQDSLYTAGRRGVGATVLLEKIAGAAAEEKRPLKEVADICREVNANARTMGMALTSCTVPAAGKPTFELGEDEMEIGIGIHGEPGSRADEAEARARHRRADGDRRGRGPPVLIRRQRARVRQRHGRDTADRALPGLQRGQQVPQGEGGHDHAQPRRLLHHVARDGGMLHHPAEAERRVDEALGRAREDAWTALGGLTPTVSQTTEGVARLSVPYDDVVRMVRVFAATIAENKAYLTELDSAIGDADHGINMDRGFQAVLAKVDALPPGDVGTLFKTVGMTLVSTVGGAGGPLYGTLFLQLGTATAGKTEITAEDWAAALAAAVQGVQARGKAELQDKTMIDALVPARDAFAAAIGEGASFGDALRRSAAAGEAGMEGTIPLVARKGRASYLGERSAGHQDPGATSSFLLLKTVAETWSDA